MLQWLPAHAAKERRRLATPLDRIHALRAVLRILLLESALNLDVIPSRSTKRDSTMEALDPAERRAWRIKALLLTCGMLLTGAAAVSCNAAVFVKADTHRED